MSELRFPETNSAEDSAGKTWGLEGSLFWYLTGGVFTSVIVLLVLFGMWHWTLTASALAASQLDHKNIVKSGVIGYAVDRNAADPDRNLPMG